MRTYIHLVLAISLTAQPVYGAEEGGLGSTATNALQGVAGALGTANNLMGSIQNSQTQMQSLVNQLAGQMNNAPTTQFDQIKMQLSAAMGEAQLCVQKNTKDYSKYKKAPADPSELNARIDATPTCSNYGAIIDSAKKLNDQMKDTNAKMACITNMQNKINSIAESAKQPFSQMTQSAAEVWNTRQKIIDAHQSIADNVEKELNEKGGMKEKLRDLEKLDGEISNALKAGSSDGKSQSINQRLENISYQNVDAANSWYQSVMTEVHSCFVKDQSRVCPFTGTTAAPADCVRAYASSTGKGTPSEKAQAKANSGMINQLFTVTGGTIKLVDSKTNIDIMDSDSLAAHADSRFRQMVSKVTANFRNQKFVGSNVNASALSNFIREQYESCYKTASARDMTSKTGQYQSMVSALKNQSAQLNQEISNMVKGATIAMTEFRTQFNKTYDRSLQQFSDDCVASESPVKSAQCLRQISSILHNEIYGTVNSTKNSGSVPYAAGTTTLNLQTMSLNQAGQPTITTTPTQCVGFKECVNVLDKYNAHNKGQAESQTKSRDEFVVTHNKNMDTALTSVSNQFGEITKMITAGVAGINEDLAKFGVNASVKTKQVEGEALVKNEKTGLYDMPKSMKAAMAGVGNYSELDDPGSITEAYNTRISTLNDKLKEAAKTKAACAVKKADLDAILNRIGSCDASICRGDRVASMLRPLESLVNKSQVMPADSSDRNNITKDFESCSRTARSSARESDRDEFTTQNTIDAIPDERRRNARQAQFDAAKMQKKKYAAEDAKSCSLRAVGDLEALAANSRDSMRGTNDKILAAIRRLSAACSSDPIDEETAIEACESAKKAVGGASPPSDEAETDVASSSTSTSPTTNPFSSGMKGAQ